MEFKGYRDVLADLTEHFGTGAWITITQLAAYDHADPRTVRKRYGLPKNAKGVNRCILARRICEMAK